MPSFTEAASLNDKVGAGLGLGEDEDEEDMGGKDLTVDGGDLVKQSASNV